MCGCFAGITLEPGLLQPGFHVAELTITITIHNITITITIITITIITITIIIITITISIHTITIITTSIIILLKKAPGLRGAGPSSASTKFISFSLLSYSIRSNIYIYIYHNKLLTIIIIIIIICSITNICNM